MAAEPWVLMYHSVTDYAQDPYLITVTPDRLRRQLDWLGHRGMRGVGVGELLSERAAGRGSGLVGLTFDDGYADFTEHALPLLQERGFTATVFVLPGRLGGDNAWDPLGPRKPLLCAAGIRDAADAGMEIGSHGMRHVSLPSAAGPVLLEETARSRESLREITGRPVEGYCYAYGDVDRRAVDAVRAAGYSYACAIAPALAGRYALPRTRIGDQDTFWRMSAKRLLHPVRRRGPAAPSAAGQLTGAGR
ncbi:polysaccharide deacetylase family protein [Streptomyces sp. H27-D2]|uniref:polysaccharide deacetylase family protein n=1 Tax=Streptomyces sp. H27-D2 TaxID=3046304 RepID=UPI002DB9343A|nr:polysaccharide deacetylase family protein [Streptomyces sp. H27-D2]MEC4020195.1 polysaccharide deacetylase family protein [Streptomyces sp. H27-D2]